MEPPVTLSPIRQIIIQDVEKIESEVKQFKDNICKAFDSLEHRVDSRLSSIAQRIQALEFSPKESTQQVESVKAQVLQLDNRTVKLDTAFRMMEDDFKHL